MQESLRGIEQQVEQVRQTSAPDGPGEEEEGEEVMGVTWLMPRYRYR